MADAAHSDTCTQCAASSSADAGCRACFEGMLAYEAQRPTVFFAVHHLTVATYSLQHPASYTRAALDAWTSLIGDVLDGRATIAELRKKNGKEFGGARRITSESNEVPLHWPRRWSVAVCDVFDPRGALPEPDDYIERARKWAAATRADLSRL